MNAIFMLFYKIVQMLLHLPVSASFVYNFMGKSLTFRGQIIGPDGTATGPSAPMHSLSKP